MNVIKRYYNVKKIYKIIKKEIKNYKLFIIKIRKLKKNLIQLFRLKYINQRKLMFNFRQIGYLVDKKLSQLRMVTQLKGELVIKS